MSEARLFRQEQTIRRPRAEVFSFFEHHSNLARLTPPWVRLRIVSSDSETLKAGARFHYRLRISGLPVSWKTWITKCEPPHFFEDVQLEGPYASWTHRHTFEETAAGTLIRDEVLYRLPFGRIGDAAGGVFVGKNLKRIFEFRKSALEKIFP